MLRLVGLNGLPQICSVGNIGASAGWISSEPSLGGYQIEQVFFLFFENCQIAVFPISEAILKPFPINVLWRVLFSLRTFWRSHSKRWGMSLVQFAVVRKPLRNCTFQSKFDELSPALQENNKEVSFHAVIFISSPKLRLQLQLAKSFTRRWVRNDIRHNPQDKEPAGDETTRRRRIGKS